MNAIMNEMSSQGFMVYNTITNERKIICSTSKTWSVSIPEFVVESF
jgi:hypothetical protein